MSDRIGVMRAGKLVQVGTPNEIYTAPKDKFVSEFMGEVNLFDVRLGEGGKLVSDTFKTSFTIGAMPAGFRQGYLVIRPEFMRFAGDGEEVENRLTGKLYNEYELGSRIQYQVRVAGHVFLLERLRQRPFRAGLDEDVVVGWNAKDSILVAD